MFILVIMVYFFLSVFEFMPLYKKKLWSDFWTNTILGIVSFTIAILLSIDVNFPSPATPIRDLITSIFGK